MSVKIPKKYLKGKDDESFYPTYIISAPSNAEKLSGYVMKMPQDQLEVMRVSLMLNHGNEWSRKNHAYVYMYEKEAKVPGHPSKRYRYTEDDLVILYGCAESSTFEEKLNKRNQIITSGTGKLVRAAYTDYDERDGKVPREGWMIAPDADQKWVYPIDYDAVRDQGKHSKEAKGFSVLEEYAISDIAVLRKDAACLIKLLDRLDYVRSLHLDFDKYEGYHDCFGKRIYAGFLGEELGIKCYNAVPIEITHEYIGRDQCETKDGEKLRKKLTAIGLKMEELCSAELGIYQREYIRSIAKEIKDLIGVEVKQNIDSTKGV